MPKGLGTLQPMHDPKNLAFPESILACQCPERSSVRVFGSDSCDDVIGSLASSVAFSARDIARSLSGPVTIARNQRRGSIPPLGSHVGHVLSVCAEPEMVRPNAKRVIAAGAVVANVHPCRDRSAQPFIGDAVCADLLPSLIELPVPTPVRTGSPNPAAACLADFGPKTLFDIHVPIVPRLTVWSMGGRPNKGTKADKRLKPNKPKGK